MNHPAAHIARAAARYSRRAARQAFTGCLIMLAFPVASHFPLLDPILIPILITALLLLFLAFISSIEVIRLNRLEKRYTSTSCPPVFLP